jgi:hypothetical protein
MPLLHHALRWLAPAALAAAVLATPARPADAAIVTLNYTVSGTDFIDGPPSADPASVSFSLSFDDSPFIFGQAAGLSILSANFDTGTVFTFSYTKHLDRLSIGGGPEGDESMRGGVPDFLISLANVSSAPTLDSFYVSGPESIYPMRAQSTTLTLYSAPAQDTPEPASLALFGVAMAALGTLRARRKHRHAA